MHPPDHPTEHPPGCLKKGRDYSQHCNVHTAASEINGSEQTVPGFEPGAASDKSLGPQHHHMRPGALQGLERTTHSARERSHCSASPKGKSKGPRQRQ
jgi:hypothetical protein